jgi:2-keto-3-deoxy-L-fuconate dehydrogenase
MIGNGGGSTVNMASLSSHLLGVPERAAYTATKAAVIGITKSVAKDYLSNSIRVNAIAPATVETPSLQERINSTGDPVAARAAFIARQPMGRVGKPEEIAHLAVYLTSDESAYTTGQILVVDAAMSL